ncbi:MAG: DNA alkylation repair protein [Acaryochloridaceae cyanobacterium SU_2_1]|nr:DNA alkylation repair protein [Acaryochloridaceae cyanobacterium SU_2_1]
MASTAQQIRIRLRSLADPAIASQCQRFFKTKPGDYAAGDQFLGIRVPLLRQQVRHYLDLSAAEATDLLHSSWHEERLMALLLLVHQFRQGDAQGRQTIFELYLSQTAFINNWDLVDSSAPQIVGAYLMDQDRQPLYTLVRSANLWERRIAIVSTLYLIRKGELDQTLVLAALLQKDPEDLIIATGWMLREVGKRDRTKLKVFLRTYSPTMPRTMLRYAIEHFPEAERQQYLRGRAIRPFTAARQDLSASP